MGTADLEGRIEESEGMSMDYRADVQRFIDIVNEVYQGDHEFPEPVEITYNDRIASTHWIGGYDEYDGEDEEYLDIADTLPLPQTEAEYRETCAEILRRVFDFPLAYQRERYAEYTLVGYGNEFAKQLKEEWQCFSEAPLHVMRIQFPTGDIMHRDGTRDYETTGEYMSETAGRFINVYRVHPDDMDRGKRTVRHEIIHWMLASCGIPYFDDCYVFWFFCYLYDGGAYKQMDEANQKVYDYLLGCYGQDPEATKKAFDISLINNYIKEKGESNGSIGRTEKADGSD